MGKKFFLTFDVDWAHKEVIADTLNLLYNRDTPATFFATHESSVFKSVIENNIHEMGIHPNFNDLINVTNMRNPLMVYIGKKRTDLYSFGERRA